MDDYTQTYPVNASAVRLAQSPAFTIKRANPRSLLAHREVSLKDSIRGGVFLLLSVAAYMAAGFACISLVEWAWTALVQ
jgi:hypothetical protein